MELYCYNISVASMWRFLLCIGKDPSLSSSSLNDKIFWLYFTRRQLSYMWLILFIVQLWNIKWAITELTRKFINIVFMNGVTLFLNFTSHTAFLPINFPHLVFSISKPLSFIAARFLPFTRTWHFCSLPSFDYLKKKLKTLKKT